MKLELVRVVGGIVVALTLPMTVETLRRSGIGRLVFTGLFAAYAIFPSYKSPVYGWALMIFVVIAALWKQGCETEEGTGPLRAILVGAQAALNDCKAVTGIGHWVSDHKRQVFSVAVTAAICGLAVVFYVDASRFTVALIDLIQNSLVAVALIGFLIAVFVGNSVVAAIVKPFSAKLNQEAFERRRSLLTASMEKKSAAINDAAEAEIKDDEEAVSAPLSQTLGQLERTLIFMFVVAGQPAGAAVVVAIKALARLPEVQRRSTAFFEYFLIGTLASVILAVASAIAVRILAGQSVL